MTNTPKQNSSIPSRWKGEIKKIVAKCELRLTDAFFRFTTKELMDAFEALGIRHGDTVLVHSSFRHNSGFGGTPKDFIDILMQALGKSGNLLMVSLPYTSSSYDYMKARPLFDVSRTPSRMGIISEVFRRRSGVMRSLHPTHPVLALGEDAAWIVEGHERSVFPCGENTPFAKFRDLNGKVLFYDVPFDTFTFIHHIEDLIKNRIPFPIYRDELFEADVIDRDGKAHVVKTHVFSERAVKGRKPEILEKMLLAEGKLKKAKLGRTRLMLVEARDTIQCVEKMLSRGQYFYEL